MPSIRLFDLFDSLPFAPNQPRGTHLWGQVIGRVNRQLCNYVWVGDPLPFLIPSFGDDPSYWGQVRRLQYFDNRLQRSCAFIFLANVAVSVRANPLSPVFRSLWGTGLKMNPDLRAVEGQTISARRYSKSTRVIDEGFLVNKALKPRRSFAVDARVAQPSSEPSNSGPLLCWESEAQRAICKLTEGPGS
jgi:hypothetical protein